MYTFLPCYRSKEKNSVKLVHSLYKSGTDEKVKWIKKKAQVANVTWITYFKRPHLPLISLFLSNQEQNAHVVSIYWMFTIYQEMCAWLPGRHPFSRPWRIKRKYLCPQTKKTDHYNLKWSVLERIKSWWSTDIERYLNHHQPIIHATDIYEVSKMGKNCKKKKKLCLKYT